MAMVFCVDISDGPGSRETVDRAQDTLELSVASVQRKVRNSATRCERTRAAANQDELRRAKTNAGAMGIPNGAGFAGRRRAGRSPRAAHRARFSARFAFEPARTDAGAPAG